MSKQALVHSIWHILVLLGMIAITTSVHAQDTLQNVQVRDKRLQPVSKDAKLLRFSPGQKIVSIDSATLQQYQQQSLATLLSQQVPVFVKSYGFNSLATLNFRGSSAAQSQVLWEGIPLVNAASGIADISLLPVMLMDKVNIVYGSSAAMWGSGNMGGALLLESKAPRFDTNERSLSIAAGAGSFHQYQLGLKGDWQSRKWAVSIKAFGQSARNDFSYQDLDGKDTNMNHARLQSGSLLAKVSYQADAANVLELQAWVQQYDREIPPALFESYSAKQQQDASMRFLFHWRHAKKRNYYFKAAYLQDVLHYEDSVVDLDTRGRTQHIYTEAGWEQSLGRHSQLLVFAPVQFFTFDGIEHKTQVRAAIVGALNNHLLKDKLQVALNLRGEQINTTGILLPGLNMAYTLVRGVTLKINAQRTYRYPTLNELYYNPGGNPDLKPEQGWGIDGGYNVKWPITDHIYLEHGGAVFNRSIKDWIIWLGGAIWTPHNIASVHSRGLETENKLVIHTGKIQWHLSASGAYTMATTTRSYLANDNSIGKQIPYSPKFSGQLNAGLTWQHLYFNYNHTYTGYRYITSDESQSLVPYQTGNVQLSWQDKIGRYPLTVHVQCQNIWNQSYAVVGFRPMPGINWLAGCSVTIR